MKLIAIAITVVVASVMAVGAILWVGAASASSTPNPPATISGTPSSAGTSVTWTITVSQNAGRDARFVLLFPTHPTGSSTTGLPLTISGDGSATFTQNGTKCGAGAAVDLLYADVTLSDLAGSVNVTCQPPTTTTTVPLPPCVEKLPDGGTYYGSCPPPDLNPTTTTVPPQGNPITPVTVPPHTDPLPNITQEQQQIQVAPGKTAGDG